MYKMIVLDDEPMIRSGLSSIVPWAELGYELVAVFEDGKEGIDYLERHEVDVVLTDIRMVEVSGLEVARRVFERKWRTKVVIISGYREFEYAKSAMQYNVRHFLLKPTRYEEIYGVFAGLKAELDGERAEELAYRRERKRSREYAAVLREQLLQEVFAGERNDPAELARRIELLDWPPSLMTDACYAARLRIGDGGAEAGAEGRSGRATAETLLALLRKETDELRFEPFRDEEGELVLCVFVTAAAAGTADRAARIAGELARMAEAVESLFGLSCDWTLPEVAPTLAEHAAAACAGKAATPPNEAAPAPVAAHGAADAQDESLQLLMRKAQAYIDAHYAVDLSLEQVADQVFLHPVYFSKQFKLYAGVNFIDYLTSVRVRRAIELLESNRCRTNEIGEKVGYSSGKYFAKVFKQATGLTPKDYVRRLALKRDLPEDGQV